MKGWWMIMVAVLAITSCKNQSEGEVTFKSIYNLQLKGLNKKKGDLSALIVLSNSHSGTDYKVKEVNLDISVDGVDVGTYYSRNTLQVKAQSELKVPIEYAVDNQKLQNSKGEYPTVFVVRLTGGIVLTDAQGNEQIVEVAHQESVHPIVSKKERNQNKFSTSDQEEGLSKAEKRLLKRKLKKESVDKAESKDEE